MVNFEKEWHSIDGRHILSVRPDGAVYDDDWFDFFKAELKDYDKKDFFLLIDIRGVEENIGYSGFTRITEFLNSLDIKHVRIGVIPTSTLYLTLGKLFDTIAEASGLDLHVEIFQDLESARKWIGSQKILNPQTRVTPS